MAALPAITGNELIKLLAKDGWQEGRKANHGRSMTKKSSDRVLVTIIPMSNESLPTGTLSAILSSKQTRIGRKGLLALIEKYGLK